MRRTNTTNTLQKTRKKRNKHKLYINMTLTPKKHNNIAYMYVLLCPYYGGKIRQTVIDFEYYFSSVVPSVFFGLMTHFSQSCDLILLMSRTQTRCLIDLRNHHMVWILISNLDSALTERNPTFLLIRVERTIALKSQVFITSPVLN